MTTEQLAQRIVDVLEKKALYGCRHQNWTGYENGNGTEVGKDIDRLIAVAKRILNETKK